MEVVWVRHFMTPGNRKKQYIGRTDEPLDMGMIPENLEEYPAISRLIVSPMLRCRQTAERIWPGIGYETEPRLRELDFGAYEGKTYEELKDEPAYQKWLDAGGIGAFPDGEDRADFQKRCVEGAERVLEQLLEEGCGRAGIVVHGGTIMAVLSAYDPEKRPFYHWQVANGAGFVVRIDEEEWCSGRHCFYDIREIAGGKSGNGETLR